MGLSARVRCRCYEEGKLKPGPVPYEDLYLDEDDCLQSRTIDEARRRMPYQDFDKSYGNLQSDFWNWVEDCCEHGECVYYYTPVGNWAGCAEFNQLIEAAGGKEKFPLLSNFLPEYNDGIYPVDKAEATLKELNLLEQELGNLYHWVLRDHQFNKVIWTSTDSGAFTWVYGIVQKAGMVGGKVFFAHADHPYFETSHFKQIPIGKPNHQGDQEMRIVCLETGAETVMFDSIGPEGKSKKEREFSVRKEPFLDSVDGYYWRIDAIRELLQASLETGNPIQWL